MKNKLNKKTICLTAAALVLAGSLNVDNALAYFTTYTAADGGVILNLGFPDTEIKEEVGEGMKVIEITNNGDYECYVRLKALTGEAYQNDITYMDAEGKWNLGADGYREYNDILQPGETSSKITVAIHRLKEVPAEGESTDFNVVIIQEWAPVLYDDNGNPQEPDWSKATIVDNEGEGEQ